MHDINRDAAQTLADSTGTHARVCGFEELFGLTDVVIEAAATAVVPACIESAQNAARDSQKPSHLVVMSIGGLVDIDLDRISGFNLQIPSGALGALDAIQAMAVAGLDEVVLTTKKPPQSLGVETITPKELFSGTAREAIKHFPKNVNVAVALSLAGIGVDRTWVKLVADPEISRNTHHVYARGASGEVEFSSANLPFPDNPKTSYLAALSAISALKKTASSIKIG